MKKDNSWLEPWVKTFKNRNVLELGCGTGMDTVRLKEQAASVTPCDKTRQTEMQGNTGFIQVDHSKPLPFESDSFEVVVASLSLHYFRWKETENILKELKRVLCLNGLLICRLNSTKDIHYGATGHPQIESGLFDVGGNLKRFFTASDIQKLFHPQWELTDLIEKDIDRYKHNKVVWEFGAISTNLSVQFK